MILHDFEALSGKYPAWFKRFLSNIGTQFESSDAEGPVRIVEQRPADGFTELDDDQLRHYSHGVLAQFIREVQKRAML